MCPYRGIKVRLTEEDFESACKQVLGNDENWRAKSIYYSR